MRLPKPGASPQPKAAGGQSAANKRKKYIQFFLVLVVGLVVVFVIYKIVNKPADGSKILTPAEQASRADIRLYGKSTDPDSMRILSSSYIDNQQFDKAEAVSKQLADKTQLNSDYITLLNICVFYNVTDKQSCYDYVINKLKPKLSSMNFADSYSIGSMLDQAKRNKDAADFYQRAYDAYDPSLVDSVMMSKDKLKSRINELRK